LIIVFVLGPRHGSDVIQHPEDVIGSTCGENIEIQCMAREVNSETVSTKTIKLNYFATNHEFMILLHSVIIWAKMLLFVQA